MNVMQTIINIVLAFIIMLAILLENELTDTALIIQRIVLGAAITGILYNNARKIKD